MNNASFLLTEKGEYLPKIAKSLFDGKKVNPKLDFNFDINGYSEEFIDNIGKISISGMQEKFGAKVEQGKIRLTTPGEQSTFILKPVPNDKVLRDRHEIPANEHLTMQIASRVYGIKTAPNALCYASNGGLVYITKRFDIQGDGKKIRMEDLATILGKSELTGGKHFKYSGSYEDVAKAIKTFVAASMIDLERFFNLIVFNYIYGNGDAHLKNFSLICSELDYSLSPAYDLLNTALHIDDDDFALSEGLSPNIEKSDNYDRTGHPCRVDFELFGKLIGLRESRIMKILNKYSVVPEEARNMINQSLLSGKAKRNYLRIVNERTTRFNRKEK